MNPAAISSFAHTTAVISRARANFIPARYPLLAVQSPGIKVGIRRPCRSRVPRQAATRICAGVESAGPVR